MILLCLSTERNHLTEYKLMYSLGVCSRMWWSLRIEQPRYYKMEWYCRTEMPNKLRRRFLLKLQINTYLLKNPLRKNNKFLSIMVIDEALVMDDNMDIYCRLRYASIDLKKKNGLWNTTALPDVQRQNKKLFLGFKFTISALKSINYDFKRGPIKCNSGSQKVISVN